MGWVDSEAESMKCGMHRLILRVVVRYYERLDATRILPQCLERATRECLRALCWRTALGDQVRHEVRGVTAAVTRPCGLYAASSDPELGDNEMAYGLQRSEVTRGENWQRKVTHYAS